MQKVFVKTLGCKVNSFDGHAIANQFGKLGYELTENPAEADITVLNTCSVTEKAEKDARYLLRRYKRENPKSLKVVTGCYAQIHSGQLRNLDTVDLVVPNELKEQLVDIVDDPDRSSKTDQKMPVGVKPVFANRQSHFKSSVTLFDRAESSQTRAYLKIQDGCNGFCAYCQIPYARGESRSVGAAAVIEEATRLVQTGVREIVLTGIHIGDYGEDGTDRPFLELLDQIVQIEDLERIRISSLEPAEFSDGLADWISRHKEKFCAHFHLPLQSGSDTVLKRMNRKYDSARYLQSVQTARAILPDCFIGADIIPGFPGETEQEFEETVAFIKKCQLSALHVFPYSKRPNTAAAKMPGHLDPNLVKERASVLRKLGQDLETDFYKSQVGSSQTVLWEGETDSSGRRKGKTGNYLNVVAPGSQNPKVGQMDKVLLKGLLGWNQFLGTFA